MNLFTARLTGKMLSTDQFEKSIQDMINRVNRWRQIEKSPELAEYYELKKRVESSTFKERKDILIRRKYKDTDEGRKMTAFQQLSSSKARSVRPSLSRPPLISRSPSSRSSVSMTNGMSYTTRASPASRVLMSTMSNTSSE